MAVVWGACSHDWDLWSRSFGDALDRFGVTVAVGPDGDAAEIVDVNGAVDRGCGEHVPQRSSWPASRRDRER